MRSHSTRYNIIFQANCEQSAYNKVSVFFRFWYTQASFLIKYFCVLYILCERCEFFVHYYIYINAYARARVDVF